MEINALLCVGCFVMSWNAKPEGHSVAVMQGLEEDSKAKSSGSEIDGSRCKL